MSPLQSVLRSVFDVSFSDLHREQLSIEHSLHDLDSAVGRLDNIFMTVYIIVATLIIGEAHILGSHTVDILDTDFNLH